MNARVYFIHALSPLHAGTGQGVGVIDLPIAREKATGLPFVPGSSIKGVLRDACTDDLKVKIFGPDTTHAEDHAGSVQVTDGRLLVLPIRSLVGTFAWVTSPYVLRRLVRDSKDAQTSPPAGVPEPDAEEDLLVGQDTAAILAENRPQPKVILEDLDLRAQVNADVAAWAAWLAQRVFPDDAAWQRMFEARFCVVHDNVLSYLLETATEITARIKLVENVKTVQKGGLWYEECLPTETILSGLIVDMPVKATSADIQSWLRTVSGSTFQVGGKATVGRGLCRIETA